MDNPETIEFEGKTYTRMDLRAGDVIPEGAMLRTLRGTLTPTSCTGAVLVRSSTYYIEKPQPAEPNEPTRMLELTRGEAIELWDAVDWQLHPGLSHKLEHLCYEFDKEFEARAKIKELEAQLVELKKELKGQ